MSICDDSMLKYLTCHRRNIISSMPVTIAQFRKPPVLVGFSANTQYNSQRELYLFVRADHACCYVLANSSSCLVEHYFQASS
jgi:hypothetical protein